MLVFYSDPYTFPLPAGHRFPLQKYRLLRRRIEALPADSDAVLRVAPRASRDELLLAHTAAFVDAFLAGQLGDEAMRRIGFPWSPELVERTLRSTGGTIAAMRAVLWGGRSAAPGTRTAAYLAGGTHHARRDRGAGYCVFNDCAVAARLAQREFAVERVLLVDTDVHQGDGSAEIFAGDEAVFTFSIHGAGNFPGNKAQSDLDIALPDRTGDEVFLRELTRGLQASFAASRPQLVFYLSGADAFAGDALGRLSISKEALARRDRLVLEHCRDADAAVVTVMGGGYARAIEDTVDIYANSVLATLARSRQSADESWQ